MVYREKEIQLTVKGISLHQESQMPVIILQSSDGVYTLPISIGPFEASAIITRLENIHPPRPLTHDLFSEMLTKHKFKLTSLHIYKAVQDKYFSRIHYRHGLKNHTMEVRPSDGIALIIRHGGTIHVNLDILKSKSDQNWIFEVDQMSGDFLFLKNNNNEHSFM
ncbi:MAG: bifunctional nuclease family protein [Spirochaetales bacterium]|nr:bifunctional nuclease family protein [Spirochaetales bacterium]